MPMLSCRSFMGSHTRLGYRLTFLLLLAAWLYPSPLFAGTSSEASANSKCVSLNAPRLSDFDGDNRLDRAQLVSHGNLKIIHIAFGKAALAHLSFASDSSSCGKLIFGDIDKDGDIDLAWISQTLDESLAWLGDGRGNFSRTANVAAYWASIGELIEQSQRRSLDAGNQREFAAIPSRSPFTFSGTFSENPSLACRTWFASLDNGIQTSPDAESLKLRGPPQHLS